jgi:hypothetical protein
MGLVEIPPVRMEVTTFTFYSLTVIGMKRPFVICLSPEAAPAKAKSEGRVEEVDSARIMKVQAVEDLLDVLQRCLHDPLPSLAD